MMYTHREKRHTQTHTHTHTYTHTWIQHIHTHEWPQDHKPGFRVEGLGFSQARRSSVTMYRRRRLG
jgi:hypothetical protein